MALLNINKGSIANSIAKSAGARVAQAVSQALPPRLVQDVQSVLSVGNIAGRLLGGAGFGFGGGLDVGNNVGTPMLGGLSLMQAQAIFEQAQSMRKARKNLFFVRVWDDNPPEGAYQPQQPSSDLFSSRIGPALGSVVSGARAAVSTVLNGAMGAVNGALGAAGMGGFGLDNSISGIAAASFDMLAMDVSYGTSLISDHVQLGSSFIDRPTGRNPTELQITTMDDEAGTLKRWFEGKVEQVAHTDGTMGLPAEYLVTMEIVHAVPSDQVGGWEAAYSKTVRLRAESLQVDLSRREQALMEHQFLFKAFDSFMGI